MKDIHDLTFKSLMAHQPFFIAFFREYLPPEVFVKMNWQSARIFKWSGEHIRDVFPFEQQAKIKIKNKDTLILKGWIIKVPSF